MSLLRGFCTSRLHQSLEWFKTWLTSFRGVLYIYEAVADSVVDTFKIKYPKINFVCTDISFLTNRAAVYLERDKYEECMKDCNTVLERGKRLRNSDHEMLVRALTIKDIALVKMAKCSKDLDNAFQTSEKALTDVEHEGNLRIGPKIGDENKKGFIN